MTVHMNVYEAKLSARLSRVAAGEEVVVARHGPPVSRQVAATDRPALGAGARKLISLDGSEACGAAISAAGAGAGSAAATGGPP